jgi:sigma-E factor negative regulatory protein RseC
MLTETGRVVALEADGLWVETIRQSTCGTCAAQKGCGHGLINRISDGKRGYVRVLPGDQAIENYRIDDQVLISIPEEVILRGSFIAYILPVITMLLGASAAVNWLTGNGDLLALLGAGGGLAVGFALVRWNGTSHRDDPSFQPVLEGVVTSAGEPVSHL